jgi:Xaa-Pro aminopeptidase
VGAHADLVFIPISADLQYLTGVQRDMPTYGAIRHPGGWLEGLWMTPGKEPVLTLTRMTVEFNNLTAPTLELRVLGDWDDPLNMVEDTLKGFNLSGQIRVALGERASAETMINIGELLPGVTFTSASEILSRQRMIKSQEEIELMQQAGTITEVAFADVLLHLKHGMTELDIIAEVDYQLLNHGALGPSFNTEVYVVGRDHELVFGRLPGKWHRELHPPVSILFDFGAIYEGYCYDFGRTVIFGTPDAEFQLIYDLVMSSQATGIRALCGGQVTAAEADQVARSVIEEAGMGEAFRHRLGHGIGLDVHEPPFLTKSDNTLLENGMLFTVEPSLLFESRLSARVEDVVLVGENCGVPLTSSFQNLIVIE